MEGSKVLQNIDPIFIMQPAIVIAICVALLLYLHERRAFRNTVLMYSLVAYSVAIALKYAVQLPTYGLVTSYLGQQSIGLGLYYGVQTMFFEVGLAYVVASYVVRKGRLGERDAEGYGAGLAFWENAVLLGALSLVNLVAYYAILSTNTSLALTVYDILYKNSPGLFDPAPQALFSVALGTVERISSILIHLAWGYLCAMAAVHGKKRLLLVALPMGMVDFLVPFATSIGLVRFEALVFAISAASVLIALGAVRLVEKDVEGGRQRESTDVSGLVQSVNSRPFVCDSRRRLSWGSWILRGSRSKTYSGQLGPLLSWRPALMT
jgi:hypothetical protein